jgi:hypothetical protein
VSGLIAQAREQEVTAVAESKRLKELAARQESLITKQREALLAVSKTSSELAAVEWQRSAIKTQLTAQKSKLLVAAGEASTVTSLISQATGGDEKSPISSGRSGPAVLEAIEKIQAIVFTVTEDCLKEENLAVNSSGASALICTVSDVIERAMNAARIDEDPEDTITRQSYVIQALAPRLEED